MSTLPGTDVSRLLRRLREDAGLTQAELARRVATTQSVISRLESDDYEGHSLSMLARIASALHRRIVVTAVGEDTTALSLREEETEYRVAPREDGGLSQPQIERLTERLVERFAERGLTATDVDEAIRWARSTHAERAVAALRGALEVGPGDVVEDVRRARAERGRSSGGGR